jgi:hypothetical protein
MKSGSRRVFRYSSTHEKDIPDGPLWQKLMPPKGFVVLPRRWVVERTIAWIDQNRRMSLGTTRGRVRVEKRWYMLPWSASWRGESPAFEDFSYSLSTHSGDLTLGT